MNEDTRQKLASDLVKLDDYFRSVNLNLEEDNKVLNKKKCLFEHRN